MKIHELRRAVADKPVTAGLALAFATATISGFAIFTNSYAVKEFDSPTVFTTLKNSVVGVSLLALLLPSRHAVVQQTRALAGRTRAGLLALGVIGGSIPFVLFFEGLSRASSGNAAFLHKTLFIWVAVLAVVLLRERVGRAQVGALGLLLLAQYLLGGPGALRPGTGETMVFVATLLWAAEVIVAKQVLASVSSEVGATARMALGAALLLTYLAVSGDFGALAGLSAVQWAWGLGTGAILLGYVTTWYGALKLAPATAVTCVLTVGAPITAALNAIAGRGLPDGEQLLGYALLLAGAAAFALLSTRAPRAAPARFALARGG